MRILTPMPINDTYRFGRRLMLSGVILFALTNALGYRDTDSPYNLPYNWLAISEYIPTWIWVTAWSLVVPLALWEMFRGKGRSAIAATTGLMYASAAAFLVSYIITVSTVGWGSREWFYFGFYLFAGLIINGLLVKVGALKQETVEAEHE